MKKVMVAMSGGVDSTVAALLLKKQGFEVVGATLRLLESDEKDDEIRDAADMAASLGIRHYVFDLSDEFRRRVIDYFRDEYTNGRTPNPCIECNRRIKFGRLFELAAEYGCEHFATGHYARVSKENGRFLLKKATDPLKDQSYVLYNLTQKQLSALILPLGNLSKTDIRIIAEESGLPVASKRDSQDICFIPNGDYSRYLHETLGVHSQPGSFIDRSGKKLGTHCGITDYTIGQRKGLGVSFGEPRFVIGKDAKANTVTLGSEAQLYADRIAVSSPVFIPFDSLTAPVSVGVKIRYSQKETPAVVRILPDGSAEVVFAIPVRAPAPGQSAVFYDGDTVIGGGIISISVPFSRM